LNLFERYSKLESVDIENFIENKQEEHSQLEFKTINNANLKSSDDRKNLAKCISGFANSEGGLIVLGVETKKNNEEIDCAIKLVHIKNRV